MWLANTINSKNIVSYSTNVFKILVSLVSRQVRIKDKDGRHHAHTWGCRD